MEIVLASASPRRQELLKLIFDEFSIAVADIEEICPEDLHPHKCPEYLAARKALKVADNACDSLVIGADTAVFLGNKMLGKPKDNTDAFNMLCLLSGKEHIVITGCALVYKGKSTSFSVVSKVKFFNLSEDEIKSYIATGEHTDKAGAYAIQGKGSLFIEKIDGDYFNIVGLPVSELNRRIKEILK
ncbi:MAG: septum formation protein Maf [Clostridia bacterium]|nr:septum formation protein Maf [Clostridia bacterium]MBP3706504.1 septum formation protein Maf [Clostridia bacterium]